MSRSLAVVLEEPERLALREVEVDLPGVDDVVVETEFSGVSAGTERLLYTGRMPPFPGMGYPLVPGYETVGRVVDVSTIASLINVWNSTRTPASAAISSRTNAKVTGLNQRRSPDLSVGGASIFAAR